MIVTKTMRGYYNCNRNDVSLKRDRAINNVSIYSGDGAFIVSNLSTYIVYNISDLTTNKNLTIFIRFKFTSYETTITKENGVRKPVLLASINPDSFGGFHLQAISDSNIWRLYFRISTGALVWYDFSMSSTPLNAVNTIALVLTNDNSIKIYANGVLVVNVFDNMTINDQIHFCYNGYYDHFYAINEYVYDVGVFNALSQSEIKRLHLGFHPLF